VANRELVHRSLDAIRAEFDLLAGDVGLVRDQKEEYENKCTFFLSIPSEGERELIVFVLQCRTR
jgi:hypothetical protein